MSTLCNRFPTAVMIDSQAIKINADFRVALKISDAMQDADLLEQEKLEVLITLLYPQKPDNLAVAVQQGIKFLNLGQAVQGSNERKVYDFTKDADYIYTAFKSSFSVDLKNIDFLHWWEFRLLFSDLKDTFFSQLVGIRNRLNNGELMDYERKFINNNKDVVLLSEPKPMDTDTADFIKNIGKGRDLSDK